MSLYEIKDLKLNDFKEISPIEYITKVNVKNYKDIKNLNNFNPNWKLYLKNQQ